jgi:hypothetical protein
MRRKEQETLSIEQIGNMKHAIGFQEWRVKNGAYEAYRNFFALREPSESWEQLVSNGYASKYNSIVTDEIVYRLSAKGLTTLEKILSVRLILNKIEINK